MDVTWDENKNISNFEKHGVWFEEAVTVLNNPLSLMASNGHTTDNSRMEYLGHSLKNRLLYVVTVEKDNENIRIISARKATANERNNYEKERI